MKESSNYSKLEKIYKKNGGCISHKDVAKAGIPSWFLYEFVKRNKLEKFAPGFYVGSSYIPDDYYILQMRYPKYIFADMSALYFHHLTDRIPDEKEVVCPQGYNPAREKPKRLCVRRVSNQKIYELGVTEATTLFGNKVRVYDRERAICDLIKYRDKQDAEVFIKAIRLYWKGKPDQIRLFNYARTLKIEKKVYEVMVIVANED